MVYNGLIGNWPRGRSHSQTEQLQGLIIISSPLSSLASPASVGLKFTLASISFHFLVLLYLQFWGLALREVGGGGGGRDGGWRGGGGGLHLFQISSADRKLFFNAQWTMPVTSCAEEGTNYRKNALLCPKTFTHASVSSRSLLYGAVGLCTVLFKPHNDQTHRHRKKTKCPCNLMVRNRRTEVRQMGGNRWTERGEVETDGQKEVRRKQTDRKRNRRTERGEVETDGQKEVSRKQTDRKRWGPSVSLSVRLFPPHLFLSVCFHLTSFCPSVSCSPLSVRLFPPHLFLSVCFLLTSFCPSVSTSPLSVRLFPPFCLTSFRPSVFTSFCPSVSTSPLSVRLFPPHLFLSVCFHLTSFCPSVSTSPLSVETDGQKEVRRKQTDRKRWDNRVVAERQRCMQCLVSAPGRMDICSTGYLDCDRVVLDKGRDLVPVDHRPQPTLCLTWSLQTIGHNLHCVWPGPCRP